MNFYKLNRKHKKWYIINQILIIAALVAMLAISWSINKVELPTNVERLSASTGFITTTIFFILAVLNRLGNLFKIKSLGFIFLFLMLIGVKYIIDPLVWTVGLMSIPLAIDDLICRPIWMNIWYNQYDSIVKIKEG